MFGESFRDPRAARPSRDGAEMPFLDHLEELRWRIIYGLASLMLAIGFGFWVTLHFDLVGMIAAPAVKLVPQHALFFTHPTDKLTITLNVAITVGLVLAAPLLAYQAWVFLSPALRRHERQIAIGVLVGGTLLFLAGVALAYVVVLPLSLPWLLDFGSQTLIPLITVEEYFSFVIALVLTFGISFELPIVVLALSALGLVTPQFLSRYRRHAIVLIVFLGAILTPGDAVLTTAALAIPLYFLYELSVVLAYMMARRRAKHGGVEPLALIVAAAFVRPRRERLAT